MRLTLGASHPFPACGFHLLSHSQRLCLCTLLLLSCIVSSLSSAPFPWEHTQWSLSLKQSFEPPCTPPSYSLLVHLSSPFHYKILCKGCVVSLLPLYLWFSLESTPVWLPSSPPHSDHRYKLSTDVRAGRSFGLSTSRLTWPLSIWYCWLLVPFWKALLTWHLGHRTLEVLFLLIVHLTCFPCFLISNTDVFLSFTFRNSPLASSLGYLTGIWNVTYPK